MSEEVKSNENLPIRQNLVDTAVGFLLNPNVKQRPNDAKIAFLKQKGLTDSEIDEAFNRVKFEPGVSNGDSQLVNAYPLPPHRMPNSFWFHLSSFSSAFVSFAVAVYVLHRFYKSYIEPWLFGYKSEMSEIAALKEQLKELNSSVSRLSSTVSSLEEAVNTQIHQIDRTSLYGVESVPESVKDILDEISNVKSLLLNRFSFPAPPALAGASTESKTQNGESKVPPKVATIPKWQMRLEVDKSSGPSSLENSLSSEEDQTQDQENNLKNTKDKIQDEGSKNPSENGTEAVENKNENSKGCLNNDLNAKSKMQEEDSKTTIENQNGKTLDGDSGAESPNYYSDCESVDQTSESILTKDSE